MNDKKTPGIAITSLVLGILSICFFCLGPIFSIPAIICGHIAKSKIKKNPDTLKGDGISLAGFVLGYIQIGLMILTAPIFAAAAIPALIKARDVTQTTICRNNLRLIEDAKDHIALEKNYGADDLISEEEISEYLKTLPSEKTKKSFSNLICRKGGLYKINAVSQPPECSVHGTLPNATGNE